MERQSARNAAFALCAVWAAGCGTAGAQDATAEQPKPVAAAADTDAGTQAFPATLDGEIARAHLLRTKGDFAEAAKALAQIMIVAPDDPRVVGEYGKVLTQQGRSSDALPFLKRAIELQENDWTLYSALGVTYDQVDDHSRARQAYEKALALQPGSPDVLNNYAVSRMLAGDLDGAQTLLAQAQAASPGNEKVANNLALLATMKHPAAAVTHAPVTAVTQLEHPTSRPAPAPQAVASGAPRVLMQKVPTDPLAGLVKGHVAHAAALAAAPSHKTKVATAKPVHNTAKVTTPSRTPMLRTAADNQ